MKNTIKNIYLTVILSLSFVSLTRAQTINIHSITSSRNGTNYVGAGYTLNGSWMTSGARLKLLNTANFGANGTYSKTVNITDAYGASGSLAQVSALPYSTIFFFGTFDKLDPGTTAFTSTEIDSVYNWSKRGGKMIINAGQVTTSQSGGPTYDSRVLNLKWGHFWNYESPSYFMPTTQGNATDIFNGPFGNVPGAYQGAGLQGYFDPVSPSAKILATNPNGKPTLLMDCNTLDLIVADIDGFTSLGNITSNANVLNDQDKFWVNTIAFMDKLQPAPVISNSNNNLGLNTSYVNYQWYFNHQPISGATGANLTPTQTGVYYTEVTLNGGCKLKSDSLVVATTATTVATSLGENKLNLSPNIYPNPFHAQTVIDFKQHVVNVEIQLTDISGRVLFNENFSGTKLEFGNASIAPGIYFLNVLSEEKLVFKEKVIVD